MLTFTSSLTASALFCEGGTNYNLNDLGLLDLKMKPNATSIEVQQAIALRKRKRPLRASDTGYYVRLSSHRSDWILSSAQQKLFFTNHCFEARHSTMKSQLVPSLMEAQRSLVPDCMHQGSGPDEA